MAVLWKQHPCSCQYYKSNDLVGLGHNNVAVCLSFVQAKVMKLYRLCSNKTGNMFQDISHISGSVSEKQRLGSTRRIFDQGNICLNKPRTAYSLTTYYLTRAIDFAEAEMILWAHKANSVFVFGCQVCFCVCTIVVQECGSLLSSIRRSCEWILEFGIFTSRHLWQRDSHLLSFFFK